jgi:hypothetical protein
LVAVVPAEVEMERPEVPRPFQALVLQLFQVMVVVVVRPITDLEPLLAVAREALLPAAPLPTNLAGLAILPLALSPMAVVVAAQEPPPPALPVAVRRVVRGAQAHPPVEQERIRLQQITPALTVSPRAVAVAVVTRAAPLC